MPTVPEKRTDAAFPGLKVGLPFVCCGHPEDPHFICRTYPTPKKLLLNSVHCLVLMRSSMQIELGLIGLDLVLLVMGQELVSFKIVDAALTTEISSAKACNGPCGETAVVVALTVVDMSLRDMQVSGKLCHAPNRCKQVRFAMRLVGSIPASDFLIT